MKIEIVAALLAGGVAGFCASLLVAPVSAPAIASAPEVHFDLDPLLRELTAMRRALELPSASSGHANGRADSSSLGLDPRPLSAGEAATPSRAELNEFFDALSERLITTVSEASHSPGHVRPGTPRNHDRQAVSFLRESLSEQTDSAPLSVFGMSPGQIYARYGTPTTTWGNNEKSLSWVYESEDESESTVIKFIDGYVTHAWLE